MKLTKVMDEIRTKFGKNSILRGTDGKTQILNAKNMQVFMQTTRTV